MTTSLSIAYKYLCFFVLLLLSTFTCTSQDSLAIQDKPVGKLTLQGGISGVETFNERGMPSMYGAGPTLAFLLEPKSTNIISPVIGVSLMRGEMYYRNYIEFSDKTKWYNSNFILTSLGVRTGIRNALMFDKFSFFSYYLLDARLSSFNPLESALRIDDQYQNSTSVILSNDPKNNLLVVYFHLQVGIAYTSKIGNSFQLVISGGRAINSFVPKSGLFDDPELNASLYPWEIGLLLGFSTPLIRQF